MSKNLTDRILIVDDNEEIHEDFNNILTPPRSRATDELDALTADLFGEEPAVQSPTRPLELVHALQGELAVELVKAHAERGERFVAAFVDFRMPPGLDGIATALKMWKIDPDIFIILSTAFADYDWNTILEEIGAAGGRDKFLVLKKPFEPVEATQLAHVCSVMWHKLAHPLSPARTLVAM